MNADPTYRACVDFAYRSLNRGTDEIYITRDCDKVFDGSDIWSLHFDKDTAILVLAETMSVKFGEVDLVDCRDNFFAGTFGESLAEKVNKHLARISIEDWDWLRERVAFYTADNIKPHSTDETKDEGDT